MTAKPLEEGGTVFTSNQDPNRPIWQDAALTTDRGPYGGLFSGGRIYWHDPRVEDITFNDIAHALSMKCRYNGHVDRFYSVAQHSVLVSRALAEYGPDMMIAGLFHDADEAYLSDLISPLKWMINKATDDYWRKLENKIHTVLAEKFQFQFPLPDEVEIADKRMLVTEMYQLMPRREDTSKIPVKPYDGLIIDPLLPEDAERMFREQYQRLLAAKEHHKHLRPFKKS